MQDTEQWFTALYEQNASKMLRYASYQLRNASIAEELILTEVKLARYHREVPLEPALNAAVPEMEVSSLADSLPEGLSDSEREILILFYEEELTHQEMSRRLGISEMNSRTRLFRAKNHCKKLFERKNCVCVTNGGDKSI